MEEKKQNEIYIVSEPKFVGELRARSLFESQIEPSTHEHRYNKKGECECGKVLPDIRPYPGV